MTDANKEDVKDYFVWLMDKVGIGCNRGFISSETTGYKKLMKQLFLIDFVYKISNDANRLGDGLALRRQYEMEKRKAFNYRMPCSVLEVLIALSIRIGDDVLGDPDSDGVAEKIFWMMIENLGLAGFYGNQYDKGACCIVVESWIGRHFEPDGSGSPFPLKHPETDQRRVEIWQQVMNYLSENPEITA